MQHRICNRYHTYFPFITHTCSFAGVLFGNKISCSKWTSKKSGGKNGEWMKCMAQKTSFAQLLLFFTVSRRANNNTLPSFSMCFKFLRSLFFPRANGFQLLFLSLLSNGTFRSLHFSSEYQMRHEKWQQESIRVKIVIFAEANNTVREQKTRRKKNWQREWS